MREKFVFFQPQDHFSCIVRLPLQQHLLSATRTLFRMLTTSLSRQKNETLFYKLEFRHPFLCMTATSAPALAKLRRFSRPVSSTLLTSPGEMTGVTRDKPP